MKRMISGVLLIAIGTLWLLQVTGQFNAGLAFWPVVLVFIGGSMFVSSIMKPSWFGLALGAYVGGIGLFNILSNAGVTTMDGGDFARGGWPIFLIAMGISTLFFKSWRFRSGKGFKMKAHSWVVGDMRYGQQGNWPLDGDLNVNSGIGDVRLDLTTAEIHEGPHHITVDGWIGDVAIKVPDNVTVTVDASANIGDLKIFGDRRDGIGVSMQREIVVPDAHTELHIKVKLAIGDVKIERVQSCCPVVVIK